MLASPLVESSGAPDYTPSTPSDAAARSLVTPQASTASACDTPTASNEPSLSHIAPTETTTGGGTELNHDGPIVKTERVVMLNEAAKHRT